MRRTTPIALATLGLLWAAPALADVPSPMNHTIPGHVVLVGRGAAGPDSVNGHVYCVIRDLASNPIPGAVVTFDFSAFSDLRIASDQHDPRVTVNCAQRSVSGVTDANGRVNFTILGACTGGPPSPRQSLRIYADGVILGSPTVAVLERDGFPGLTLTDLSIWAADWFSGLELERADLDGTGGVNALDLSVWGRAWFGGNNAMDVGSLCP